MHDEQMIRPASPLQLREALDDAIRCLAVSTGSMRERLHAAGIVLLGLSRADFVCSEDGELFDQIETSLTKLGRDQVTFPYADRWRGCQTRFSKRSRARSWNSATR